MLESTVARFGMERPLVGIQIRRTDKVGRLRNPTTYSKTLNIRYLKHYSILWRST